jgi:hypothetical protein
LIPEGHVFGLDLCHLASQGFVLKPYSLIPQQGLLVGPMLIFDNVMIDLGI